MYLISKIVDGGNLTGYLVGLRENEGDRRAYTPFKISREEFMAAVLSDDVEGFEGDMDVILSRYSSITSERHVLGSQGLVVVNELKVGDDYIGVDCFDAVGLRYKVSYKKFERLCLNFVKCNFELGQREDGSHGVVGLNGFVVPVVDIEGDVRVGVSSDELGALYGFTPSDDDFTRFGRSAQEKLALAKHNLYKIAPYFHTVLNSINRVPANVGTMCVTEDTMYYDLEFVAGLTVAECTFVLIHEMMHLLMQHSIRFAGRKNHKLWNVATDLYINTLICRDFGAVYKGIEVMVPGVREGMDSGVIKAPEGGIFVESVGIDLDLNVDTPEKIYDELLSENSSAGGDSGDGEGSDEGSGKGSKGSGKGSGKKKSSKGSAGDDSSGKGESGDGEGSESGDNNGSGSDDKSGSESDDKSGSGSDDKSGSGSDDKSGSGSDGASGDNQSSDGLGGADVTDLESGGSGKGGSRIMDVKVTFRGKELRGKIMDDLKKNEVSDGSESSIERSINASKMALQSVKTRLDIMERDGMDFGEKTCGVGGSFCKRCVDIGLGLVLDWRLLCKNMCKIKPKKMYTLGAPQRDYMSMGMTLPGRERMGKPSKMTGIKFAVDVSGSVSKSELDFFLSELGSIFRYFDVTGELIYWSDGVGHAGDFRDMQGLLEIEPVSSGGTDVLPLFQYLMGEIDTDTGVRQKTRVRDITGVFILTDGYFSMNFDEYEDYFGKKVVWIIAGKRGNILAFRPPFGSVVELEIQ